MGGLLHSPEFWVTVGFVILVAAIAKPMTRAATSGLDARIDRIKATLDEAQTLREEAQHLLAGYQRQQRGADDEIKQLVAHARTEAERLTREAAERLSGEIARREQMAREKIEMAEADALQAVRDMTVDVAITASQKLIAAKLDTTRSGALVDRAIAELPRSLH